jgi:hypothetical protein
MNSEFYMKSNYKLIIAFLLGFSIFNFDLFSQSRFNNKITEFGIFNYSGRKAFIKNKEVSKDRVDSQIQPKAFTIHPLPKFTKQFEISKKNTIISKKGIKFTIPANAFQYSDFLTAKGYATAHIYEVYEEFDYLLSGINQVMNEENNQQSIIEMGGMFKIEIFQGNAKLKMSGEFPIIVEFPNLVPDQNYAVFHVNSEGNWKKKYDAGTYTTNSVMNDSESKKKVGTRRISIPLQGWWCFGIVHSQTSALKGEIIGENISSTNFNIYNVGDGFFSVISKSSVGKDFSIISIPNRKSKILIFDETNRIGIGESIISSTTKGVDYLPDSPTNYRMQIPPIKMQKIESSVFNDKEQLKKTLGFETHDFEVIYQSD